MPDSVLVPGIATAIGSLPHRDAAAAAALVLRCLPELPAAPQLPMRTPLEGFVAQWARAIEGVRVENDGTLTVHPGLTGRAPIDTTFDALAHGGLLAFLDIAAAQPKPPRRVKVQCAGPLTLGVALVEAGVPVDVAFALGARTARAWAHAIENLVATRLPERGARAVLRRARARALARRVRAHRARVRDRHPLDRARAPACLTAVHVCGTATSASRSTPARASCTSTPARSTSTTP